MSRSATLPETPTGAYAERRVRPRSPFDRFGDRVMAPLLRRRRASWRRWAGFPRLVDAQAQDLAERDDAALREAADDVRAALRQRRFEPPAVARAFALVREVAARTLGERHFDVQLVGGRVLLDGMIAEMETGEGKTLTATLAASTAALAGIPVHVVTVNDYLATRDAQWMAPIYRALGVSVGVVVHGMDNDARRAAYAADITYVTNKEIAFDYLRDRLVLGQRTGRISLQLERLAGDDARARRLVLRGLHYAIVDEADSVLIDEARTPLIISGGGRDRGESRVFSTALALADRLEAGSDFIIDPRDREVRLTDAGAARLDDVARPLGGVWRGRVRREELVRQALTARHLFHRDQHYLVHDDKVQIVDEFTGRVMADRSWEHGLHQLIEVKEACPVTAPHQSLARVSYQRFFTRYLRLAGMTGTAREVRGELWSVYRLALVSIPTNRRMRRTLEPDRMYVSEGDRWDAVVDRVVRVHESGRPILLGTRSVAASEHLSGLLDQAGLAHRVLNARQDAEEAQIVADAGQRGRITVATNMAGRGTDIRLGPGVGELGGLHVIATERHEARRIDRQLFGRSGRQGEPGSAEAILSLEDELLALHGPRWRRLVAAFARADGSVPTWLARRVVALAQKAAERLHARMRGDLLRVDEQLESTLAFSGRPE